MFSSFTVPKLRLIMLSSRLSKTFLSPLAITVLCFNNYLSSAKWRPRAIHTLTACEFRMGTGYIFLRNLTKFLASSTMAIRYEECTPYSEWCCTPALMASYELGAIISRAHQYFVSSVSRKVSRWRWSLTSNSELRPSSKAWDASSSVLNLCCKAIISIKWETDLTSDGKEKPSGAGSLVPLWFHVYMCVINNLHQQFSSSRTD